jgi:hypothetical protein
MFRNFDTSITFNDFKNIHFVVHCFFFKGATESLIVIYHVFLV